MKPEREESESRDQPPSEPAKRGRPSIYTPEIAQTIIDGLSAGTPLTIICEGEGMPCADTVRSWMKNDEAFSQAIARAREAGFDQIALDALRIADNTGHEHEDTIETKFGEIPNKEWIMRSKLRVETRLKLLAKWDPKRYGDKVTQEISGPDGKPIRTAQEIPQDLQDAMLAKVAEAAASALRVEPPASFKGQERDE